ncbi:hypothetical protein HPP92_013842 [Vanilla planifolia]|uniref:Ribosomal protein L34e superfamily protein n=1 Tax=Vanilla planifolia TaxID=51239 RepID=A0A835UZ88_VANPL|nr:hypothetical protein HPP92_013842 [Vanilla planifolia]
MGIDCRSLIEFCRDFDHSGASNPMASSDLWSNSDQYQRRRSKSASPLSHTLCEHSPSAAVDILILLLALGALGVLTVPCFKLIFREACELLPITFDLILEVIYDAPVAYAAGVVLVSAVVIAAWEIVDHKSRKCGNPGCRALRKAVEFDIQLESEECVRLSPHVLRETACSLELGEDHKELEAELKKLAPPNGRTVLIFRSRCGCPAGRMEVWGHKKVRKIKK